MKFAMKSMRVLTPEGMREAVIIVEDGCIVEILEYSSEPDIEVIDYGELVLMPGLVDTHVHINEPGRTSWEGFLTATKSAAAGGITMLVDMPLNSLPVTTNVNALNKKIDAAKGKLFVDCGFYGGIIPGNENDLNDLIANGVMGLKAFLIHSGIEEFPNVTEYDLRNALNEIRHFPHIPVLVHAEMSCGVGAGHSESYDKCSFHSFASGHTKEMEYEAVDLLIRLCRETDHHIHIVHLSSSDCIDIIRAAKNEGLKLTVETCPHYLTFTSVEIADKETKFKCTPPIRDWENREKLWQGVKEGVIDFIASDHSPCNPKLKYLKEGDFENAWGGISSLQISLPAVWTEARNRGFTLEDISRLMSANTAGFIGEGHRKGKIRVDYDADIVVFDPDKSFTMNERDLFHRHKITPYSGKELYGVVEATYLRGKKIFEKGKFRLRHEGWILKSVARWDPRQDVQI
jgi:allantoinase